MIIKCRVITYLGHEREVYERLDSIIDVSLARQRIDRDIKKRGEQRISKFIYETC